MNCPNVDCGCSSWPPVECPQCGTVILGATGQDWREHFEENCTVYGTLYCFVPIQGEPA